MALSVVLFSHSLPTALNQQDEVAIIKLEQYGSRECTPIIDVHSDTSSETNTPTLLKMLGSSSSSSSESYDFRFEMGDTDEVVEVKEEVELEEVIQVIEYEEEEEDQREEVDEMDEVEREDEEEDYQMDQMEEVVQESPSSSTMPADSSAELPLKFKLYIKRRELQLAKKFKKQLEEKTEILQAGLRLQQENMNMMKEQLKNLHNSKLQAAGAEKGPAGLWQWQTLVAPVCCPDNLESQPSEPLFKKQRTEEMTVKTLLPDLTVTRYFQSSCSSTPSKFPEELGKTCSVSTQTQPRVPLELVVENEPSGCCKEENLDVQKDESFCPEDQQEFSINPLPLANDPNVETTSANFSQPPIASDSNGVTLETPQDFIQIWEQSSTSPNCLFLKQVVVPEAGAQEPSGAQAVQDPAEYSSENVTYFLSGEQPDLHEQFIHTKP
ncbi:circadian clock protein PASD1 [Rhinolophus ferrumequinum]|uniref:circadian clock protein PASD1 n=1 Tax=Rhinolophus ferrumequinum TaxID=59479 RepID=UPI00140FBDF1|nr:circadian clock protein PASD1 [Rhinolophus ferrumequinum]